MDRSRLRELIESSDLAGLVREVDVVAGASDWEGMAELRRRCEEAVERGKQVWAVAQFAEYRTALEAPADVAASVLADGAGRNTLGPLWEVAASTHTWAELDPHITATRQRALVAHERSMRGEDVDAGGIEAGVVDVPVQPQRWEPPYPVAEYESDRAHFPEGPLPDMPWVELPVPADPSEERVAADALLDLVSPWVDQSSGRAEVRAVAGSGPEAVAALGLRRVRLAEVDFAAALSRCVWTGASGGAFGRRRGSPVGRALSWWAVACLAGMEDDWPVDPAELGTAALEMRWFLWDPGDSVGGWNFHLAVEDPVDGLAWAIGAADWK